MLYIEETIKGKNEYHLKYLSLLYQNIAVRIPYNNDNGGSMIILFIKYNGMIGDNLNINVPNVASVNGILNCDEDGLHHKVKETRKLVIDMYEKLQTIFHFPIVDLLFLYTYNENIYTYKKMKINNTLFQDTYILATDRYTDIIDIYTNCKITLNDFICLPFGHIRYHVSIDQCENKFFKYKDTCFIIKRDPHSNNIIIIYNQTIQDDGIYLKDMDDTIKVNSIESYIKDLDDSYPQIKQQYLELVDNMINKHKEQKHKLYFLYNDLITNFMDTKRLTNCQLKFKKN